MMDKTQLRERMIEIQDTLLRVEEDIRRLRLPSGDSSALRLSLESGDCFHLPIAFVTGLENVERGVYALLWELEALAQMRGLAHLPFHQTAHERIQYQDALCAATTD